MKIYLLTLLLTPSILAEPIMCRSCTDASKQARVHVQDNSIYTLSNHLLTWRSRVESLTAFTLQKKGLAAVECGEPAFAITTTEGSYPATSFRTTDVQVKQLEPAPFCVGRNIKAPAQSISATFTNEKAGITIKWHAELRDSSLYIKQIYAIYATRPIEITHIDLMRLAGSGYKVKEANNSLLIHSAKHQFFAIENAPAVVKLKQGEALMGFDCQLPMRKGQCYSFSTVQGVYP